MPRGVMNILGKGQVQIGDGRGGPARFFAVSEEYTGDNTTESIGDHFL